VELGGHSWSVVGGIGWRQKKGGVMMVKNGMGGEFLTSGQQTINSDKVYWGRKDKWVCSAQHQNGHKVIM